MGNDNNECVPWRDFERLEKIVLQNTEEIKNIRIDHAREVAELKTSMGAVRSDVSEMKDAVKEIRDAVSNNKVNLAKVMVAATLLMSIVSYGINRYLFMR